MERKLVGRGVRQPERRHPHHRPSHRQPGAHEKGEPICMMDSFVDLTDRKRIEEELKIKDFCIASSIDGIGIIDLEAKSST
jgi:hypothetical protein